MADIFLSYRHEDEPGYVARIADFLEEAFGTPVFRDIECISAGSDWKTVLRRSVSASRVLITILGRQWCQLLEAKTGEGEDYVVYELNLARTLDIPIIPVLLHERRVPDMSRFDELQWLNSLQFLTVSDGQGRWQSDMAQLTEAITRLTGLPVVEAGTNGSDENQSTIHQTSTGHQSPNIITESGNVVLNFGSDKDDQR